LVGVLALPALIIGGWYVWSRNMPPTGSAQRAAEIAAQFLWKPSWPGVFLNRALMFLPLTALFAWTAVRFRRAHLPLVALWLAIMGWGTFAIALPEKSYSFVGYGNIIRTGGIDFFEYRQEPIWTPEIWKGLAMLGAGLAALMLAKMTVCLLDWLRDLRNAEYAARNDSAFRIPHSALGRSLKPALALYLVGILIFAVSLGFLALPFDRYTLAFLPFVILFMVRGTSEWGRLAWGYSIAALALVAGFSLLAKADFVDHDNARWEAGKWLAARAPLPIHVGYDWDNWLGYPSGHYEITDVPIVVNLSAYDVADYRTYRSFPYLSRLSGFTTRYVLAQSRLDAPPLREPGASP